MLDDLFLSPGMLEAAAAAIDPSLKAPSDVSENPTFRAGKAKGLGTWAEAFIIRDTSYGPPKNPKEGVNAVMAKLVLDVLGPSDGGFETNAGRMHFHTGYIDQDALRDPKHPLHRMNNIKIGVLRSLFNAVGLDMAEGISTKEVLNGGADGVKMLVGQRVQGIVRKYTYTSKQGEEVTQCEVDAFSPLA